MSYTVKTIDIPSGLNPPVRIDKYLASLAELALSRSRIQRLIADGHITVDGETVEARHKLTGGERVVVTVIPEPSSDLTPEN
ncbi:MAG: RNA pseudouridine synthase, partial [Candidatus Zixiibacteriota bacterium]